MAELKPVDFDPFAPAPASAGAAPARPAAGPKLVPVDHDPFAAAPKAPETSDEAAIGRGIINGVPVVGPYILGGLNRAAAGIRSVGSGKSFDEELRNVEAFDRALVKNHPKSTMAGEIGGGIVGTAPLVVAAPAAFGAGGGGLLTRSLLSTASGGILGGADSAVRSGGDKQATKEGAAIGAAFGLASPLAGQLIGRGVQATGEAVASRFGRAPGVGSEAGSLLAADLKNAGGVDPVRARLSELGPDAMLLDAAPTFEGRAQGLAVLPDTRQAVVSPLVDRAKGANGRLATDIDGAAGPATTPSAFHANLDESYQRVVPPLYQRAFAQPVEVDTSNILSGIRNLSANEKGGAATALQRAWNLMHVEGDVPGVGRAMVPDRRPEALHNAKEALDGMIAAVKEQSGSAATSELRALSLTRRALNDALEKQVPGYDQANRVAERYFKAGEAFDEGQTLLNGGRESIRPDQLASQRATMAPEAQEAQRQGLRAEIDRIVGTKANDRVALAEAVKGEGDWNRQRLAEVFGLDARDRLVGAVDREKAFDAAHQRIVNNSQTEMRRQSAESVRPREVEGGGTSGVAIAGAAGGPTGLLAALGLRAARTGASALGREGDLARNRELAGAVTKAAGPDLDVLLDALGRRLSASDAAKALGDLANTGVAAASHSQADRARKLLPLSALGLQ